MPPFLLKTDGNPNGVDRSVLDRITARIAADRPAAMKDFMDDSYNVDVLGGDRVSDQAWQNTFYMAIAASAQAARDCVTACQWLPESAAAPPLPANTPDSAILPSCSPANGRWRRCSSLRWPPAGQHHRQRPADFRRTHDPLSQAGHSAFGGQLREVPGEQGEERPDGGGGYCWPQSPWHRRSP
jgi:hypothetical protein